MTRLWQKSRYYSVVEYLVSPEPEEIMLHLREVNQIFFKEYFKFVAAVDLIKCL